MKVLHLSSERSWRGGEQQIAYLIEELEKQEVECVVACRKGSAFEAWCIKNEVAYLPLSFANEFDVFSAWQVKNFCNEMGVDIVHMHSGHSHAIGVWSSVFGNRARLILSRRVDFPIKKNWFSRFKFNYKKIERIICVSDEIKRITQQDLKNPKVCVTVHSGIDPRRFESSKKTFKIHKELGVPNHTRLIANVSAIAPHKDYITFVNTVEVLTNKGFQAQFLIIGDGPDRSKIEQYVSEKQLSNVITFTGFRSDIEEIIKDLDVLLITSKTEGLGTTILDAFINEISVVATNAGGIPELVEHGKTGMLADIEDASQLANHVIEIFKDEDASIRMKISAKEKVLDGFTNRKMAESIFNVYKRIPF